MLFTTLMSLIASTPNQLDFNDAHKMLKPIQRGPITARIPEPVCSIRDCNWAEFGGV